MKNAIGLLTSRIRINRGGGFSKVVLGIAAASVALGIFIMILSVAILNGFKDNIQAKILSFTGHMEITKFSLGNSYEHPPVSKQSNLYQYGTEIEGVSRIQSFVYKPALMSYSEDSKGVIFKGIGQDFDLSTFRENLLEGELIQLPDSDYAKEIVISKKISKLLKLKVGEEPILYFIQNPVRARKLKVVGIYETGLEGFDENILLGDIRSPQQLNYWPDSLVGGYEVYVEDFEDLDLVEGRVFDVMEYSTQLEAVDEKYPQLFEWMTLLDRNVAIIIGIILVVASFNMVSSLIVLIMERTTMIGTLKALGAKDSQIRNLFFRLGARILLFGVLLGNVLGIGFCFLQDRLRLFKLDPENYYMDSVPISFEWWSFLGLNLLTIIVVGIFLILPTWFVSRLKPVQSIRFS